MADYDRIPPIVGGEIVDKPGAARRQAEKDLHFPQRTHWDGCWRDPAHHACAVAEVERLRATLDTRTATRGGVIDDLTHRAVAAERKLDAALEVVEAARAWRLSRKPIDWTPARFIATPRLNSCGDEEVRLASALAAFDAATEGE